MQPFLIRLPKGADLVDALNTVCREHSIRKASVSLIGALERAELGFYRQDEKTYVSHPVDEPVEIVSGIGNVSVKDDAPFCHLHLCLSDASGRCVGGHAMAGCVIFAAEACITEVPGEDLVRGFDEPTGLPLWHQEG